MKIVLVTICLSSVLLCSCTYSGAIRTNIAPTTMTGKKLSSNVGVYFNPRLASHIETTTPVSACGSAHTYSFDMGPALTASLKKSVEAAYSQVSVLQRVALQPDQFERIVRFDLQSPNVRIEFLPRFWAAAAKADASIQVSMEIIEGSSLKAIQRFAISGTGFVVKDANTWEDAHKIFSIAIEDAIQQVSENAAILLISGVGEPLRAEGEER